MINFIYIELSLFLCFTKNKYKPDKADKMRRRPKDMRGSIEEVKTTKINRNKNSIHKHMYQIFLKAFTKRNVLRRDFLRRD